MQLFLQPCRSVLSHYIKLNTSSIRDSMTKHKKESSPQTSHGVKQWHIVRRHNTATRGTNALKLMYH
jgi:hypothetical protein